MRDWLFSAVTQDDFPIPQNELNNGSFTTVLQIVFGIAGGVALIMLMLAALKYVLSRGDPNGVARAKDAIIYALIGLAVCAAAFSIVSFVVKSV
jgi:hypothetical protein